VAIDKNLNLKALNVSSAYQLKTQKEKPKIEFNPAPKIEQKTDEFINVTFKENRPNIKI
jgi:hypothetical protein